VELKKIKNLGDYFLSPFPGGSGPPLLPPPLPPSDGARSQDAGGFLAGYWVLGNHILKDRYW